MNQEYENAKENMLLATTAEKNIRRLSGNIHCDPKFETASVVGIVETTRSTVEHEGSVVRQAYPESELARIEEALDRINDRVCRICRQCGHLIEFGQLEANPFATLCAECKRKQGKNSPRHENPNQW